MDSFMNAAAVQRLERYFQQIGEVLGEENRRGSFALDAMGLLGDGERKSVEPLAARACPDPARVDAMHQRLLHFAVDSKWSDRDVRRQAARYALEAMTQQESVEAWIVDATGFLKQGKHSVGVQRQHLSCSVSPSIPPAPDAVVLDGDDERSDSEWPVVDAQGLSASVDITSGAEHHGILIHEHDEAVIAARVPPCVVRRDFRRREDHVTVLSGSNDDACLSRAALLQVVDIPGFDFPCPGILDCDLDLTHARHLIGGSFARVMLTEPAPIPWTPEM
ncbi:transposase [Myxococcus sp. 1LA]